MSRDSSLWLLAGAVAVAGVLTAAAALAAVPLTAGGLELLGIGLASLLVFPDLIDLGIRLYFGGRGDRPAPSVELDVGDLSPYQKRIHLRPWALMMSVHEIADRVEDVVATLAPYRERLWVIDDGSRDDTCRRFRLAGCRCVEGGRNRRKPGALRQLLANLPPSIETVVVLDPDVTILDSGRRSIRDLEEVLFDFQRSRCAALTPRVSVREDGLLARFQGLEYGMSLGLGRKSLVDFAVNSGVSVYRRDALEAALKRHSMSVYAEDLEGSLLMLGCGERVYYDDRLVVSTEAKRSWRSWFSQRVGWFFGLIRVYTERFAEVRTVARRGPFASYQYLVYLGLFSLVFHPLRVLGLVAIVAGLLRGVDDLLGVGALSGWRLTPPVSVLIAWGQYTLLAAIGLVVSVPRRERTPLWPVVPLYFFYVLAHILPVTIGFANFFSLRWTGRRLYRDHFASDEEIRATGPDRRAAAAEGA